MSALSAKLTLRELVLTAILDDWSQVSADIQTRFG